MGSWRNPIFGIAAGCALALPRESKIKQIGKSWVLEKERPKMTARSYIALILCALLILLSVGMSARDNGYTVKYDGGSIPSVKAGNDLRMYIDTNQIRLLKGKEDVMTIPAAAITEISYGQDVHRRVGTAVAVGMLTLGVGALVALSKSKKHFVGLTWANGDQKGGFAMQCDKSEYRGILAGIEGITGKKAVDSTTMTVKN
jgi:hypothetical protein